MIEGIEELKNLVEKIEELQEEKESLQDNYNRKGRDFEFSPEGRRIEFRIEDIEYEIDELNEKLEDVYWGVCIQAEEADRELIERIVGGKVRSRLRGKDDELSFLEDEARTITETENLINRQHGRQTE